jgi:methyl-accepting chemotaxis protein
MFKLLNSLALTKRIVLIVAIGIFVISTILIINFISDYKESAFDGLIKKAASFTAVADETKNHVAKLHEQKVFNYEDLLEEVYKNQENNGDYKTTRFFKTIPIVAGWTAAEKAAAKENINFKIIAFDARNKEHEPTFDKEYGNFRAQLLRDLESQVKNGGDQTIYRVNENNNSLYYLRSVQLVEGCMSCHGNPANSPYGDGTDLLGFKMENWKVGDSHGAYEIVMSLVPMDAAVSSMIFFDSVLDIFLLIVVLSGIVFFIKKMVVSPINECIKFASEIESGDLSGQLDYEHDDEVGELVSALNNMSTQLKTMFKQIIENAGELNSMSDNLLDASEQATSNVAGMVEKSGSVASATEELSVSMSTVSNAAQEASSSISMVASSTDEMTSTVTEIAQNTSRAQSITQNAVSIVQSASQQVNELGRSANEITNVIEVINEISEQTKLLALNATIEAARAGEAGKGFAVVANEVKELAKQTNDAIDEIKNKIDSMQTSTKATISEIGQITDVIKEVSDIVTGIASAVEEQSVTTKDIAGNISIAAQGTQDMATSVNQAAEVTHDVARDIAFVSNSSNEINSVNGQVNSNAANLALISNNLKDLMTKFKLN